MSTVLRCDVCHLQDAPGTRRLAIGDQDLPPEVEDKWLRKRFTDFMVDVEPVDANHAKLKDICEECWSIWITAYVARVARYRAERQ